MNQPYGIAVDPDAAAQRANALLESEIKARIDAVRAAAQRLNALNAAIAEYETAWQSATQAGWTEDKLRDVGLRSPDTLPAFAGRRVAAPAEQSPTIAPVVQLSPPAPVAPLANAAQSTL
ncbi:hypothetical protein [Leifsonia sp. NPDC058230]|uniref:hypothetical protein n=1 Tax=Leifsonia sp. NPDC058230 TaxID=3346391 RepID=UPI0036DBC044